MAANKANSVKLKNVDKIYGYLFIAPIVIGFLVFILGPMLYSFVMSFSNWSLLKEFKFTGLDNYKQVFLGDKKFWTVMFNTLYFSIGLVPLNLVLAFSLALLLKQKLRGIGFFRTAIFTPVVTSVVVWAIVWKFILGTDGGLINILLKGVGITGPAWLYDMRLTMPVVIVVSVLKNVGNNMVLFLSALYNVPEMYYEAATLDGASKWQQMRKITLPMISPTIFMLFVITMISSLKVFGQIYVLTGGGPGNATRVLVYYIYDLAFKQYEFGYASAIAFILFTIILILTIVQWNLKKRWVHYEE
jgi:multiple sugar transport system permease protein